jgi:hypothetical protein
VTAQRLDLHDLRIAGGVMLVVAFVIPLVPYHPGTLCPLRATTGVPCPLCGMTTSVVDTVHLHPATAAAANPVGLVAVMLAVLLLMRPRWTTVYLPGWAPSAVLAGMWLFELRRVGIL